VLIAVEGIYKDGEVELLERPEGLAEARVIVTFLPLIPAEASQEAARNRLLSRLRAGIPLGGPPYSKREAIDLTSEDETRSDRRPHPAIAGKMKIHGEIFDSTPEGDWTLK
jgi:hypothetical protein